MFNQLSSSKRMELVAGPLPTLPIRPHRIRGGVLNLLNHLPNHDHALHLKIEFELIDPDILAKGSPFSVLIHEPPFHDPIQSSLGIPHHREHEPLPSFPRSQL